MWSIKHSCILPFILLAAGCSQPKDQTSQNNKPEELNLLSGDITLCGSGVDQFGLVNFNISGNETIRSEFNTATALLHSFEYAEAEKVYAKIIRQDSTFVMAYWGAAMCNFHPLWTPPSDSDLEKGERIVNAARLLQPDTSSRESHYIEAVATIYDQWKELTYKNRLLKFEAASKRIADRYNDKETAIFYALALTAAADPTDKTFEKQKLAASILDPIFNENPLHPGAAHYLIHTFDYPELAALALPAARKYASIAPASAHAQHMPSHIFTRLGLWEDCIRSNQSSISSAQCYAQKSGITGHWDEEIHGIDYLVYAYLQMGDDDKANEQAKYIHSITEVYPQNFKVAYPFAAVPARIAIEQGDWAAAANLKLEPANFPWERFLWERSNLHLARLLGAVHTGQLDSARASLREIQSAYDKLVDAKENYKANLVLIQSKSGEAWIKLKEGKSAEAIQLMKDAADLEDATTKHPVTPGEIIPARELLGNMFLEIKDFNQALVAFETNLKSHPGRFNGLAGAAYAAEKSGDQQKAKSHYEKLIDISVKTCTRKEVERAKMFSKKKIA